MTGLHCSLACHDTVAWHVNERLEVPKAHTKQRGSALLCSCALVCRGLLRPEGHGGWHKLAVGCMGHSVRTCLMPSPKAACTPSSNQRVRALMN